MFVNCFVPKFNISFVFEVKKVDDQANMTGKWPI